MRIRKTQYLLAALLAGVFLFPAFSSGAEPTPAGAGLSSPSPTASPSPPPTPRPVSLALYFRRPARILPIHRRGEAAAIPLEDFEICDETPWLTEADLEGISYHPEDEPRLLRLHLGQRGKWNFGEAMMGNVGRTIILAIDDTARASVRMVPVARKDRIDFSGDFSAGELEQLQEYIQFKPSPSPLPSPSPSPAPSKRFIIR